MTSINRPCEGTRQPTLLRRESGMSTGYRARYGDGLCSVCGRLVACHKDGTAVLHQDKRAPRD